MFEMAFQYEMNVSFNCQLFKRVGCAFISVAASYNASIEDRLSATPNYAISMFSSLRFFFLDPISLSRFVFVENRFWPFIHFILSCILLVVGFVIYLIQVAIPINCIPNNYSPRSDIASRECIRYVYEEREEWAK